MTLHTGNAVKALLVVVALLAAGCASNAYFSHMQVGEITDNNSDESSYDFEVSDDADAAAMHIEIRGTQGSAAWTLTDANSVVRWEGMAQGDVAIDDVREFDPIPGTWTLRLTLKNFSGDYHVHLDATGSGK